MHDDVSLFVGYVNGELDPETMRKVEAPIVTDWRGRLAYRLRRGVLSTEWEGFERAYV